MPHARDALAPELLARAQARRVPKLETVGAILFGDPMQKTRFNLCLCRCLPVWAFVSVEGP